MLRMASWGRNIAYKITAGKYFPKISSFSSTISFNVPQILGDTDLLLVSGFRVGYSIGEQINKQHFLMLAVDAIYQQIIAHKVTTPKAHSLHGLVFHYIQNRC